MLEKLGYGIERIFRGERGIVGGVELCSEKNIYGDEKYLEWFRHNYGRGVRDFPQKVTFRNPIGELVTKLAPSIGLVPTICDPITYEACCLKEVL